MGFLKLNRYGDPTGVVFDPEAIIEKVRRDFAGVEILPGDQLALSAKNAASAGVAEHVVKALDRNQKSYGPAYAFEIPIKGHSPIQGRARRFDVTFIFAEPLPSDWRNRLMAFLQELGPGKLECADDAKATRC